MADQQHVDVFLRGVAAWNDWRHANPGIRPELSGEDLSRSRFQKHIVRIVSGSAIIAGGLGLRVPQEPFLDGIDLREADLSGADLSDQSLERADLTGVRADGVRLRSCDLRHACLVGAHLNHADLTLARMVDTDVRGASLDGCRVYGISAWDLRNLDAVGSQRNLIVTPIGEIEVTVDNLDVAQFIYLILTNRKLRDVLMEVTTKAVLILGRFGPRKQVLDAVRGAIRERGRVPILFDFERPSTRDTTETVRTLAHMVNFVIADSTEPRSLGHEVTSLIPYLEVPLQPILEDGQATYGMAGDHAKYDWFLPAYRYRDTADLLANLDEKVIGPAETKATELSARKARRQRDAQLDGLA